MRKTLLLLTFIFSLVRFQSAKAQYYFYNNKYYESPLSFEVGGSIGIMNSLTDLGGKEGIGKKFIKDLNWRNLKPSFGVYVLGMYKYAVAGRIEATFGSVQAYDSILKSVAASTFGRYERNLSFRSKITDIQFAIEVHPLFFKSYEEDQAPFISPYLVGGVGYYSFNPETQFNGNWVALHPLRLEGQGFTEYPDRKPYKLNQINIAVGFGVKYEVSHTLNARLEVVHRFLNTDYLDDASAEYIDGGLFDNYLPSNLASLASQLHDRRGELNPNHIPVPGEQRGDPKDNDAFFSIQLKVGFILGRKVR